jgi:hypothetical protein
MSDSSDPALIGSYIIALAAKGAVHVTIVNPKVAERECHMRPTPYVEVVCDGFGVKLPMAPEYVTPVKRMTCVSVPEEARTLIRCLEYVHKKLYFP